LLQAQHEYLTEHGSVRGDWAPPAGTRRLGLAGSEEDERKFGRTAGKLTAKGYHQHFEDLSAELTLLMKGGVVFTKDRVEREASLLAQKAGNVLEEEVDSVVADLRQKVGENVAASEVCKQLSQRCHRRMMMRLRPRSTKWYGNYVATRWVLGLFFQVARLCKL